MMSIEIEEHPWERFFILHDQPNYKLIRKKVDAGGKLSYHYHHKPSEAWTIVEGTGEITLDGQNNEYIRGHKVLIPQGVKHRMENKTSEKVVFIEVQTGSYLRIFGEDQKFTN